MGVIAVHHVVRHVIEAIFIVPAVITLGVGGAAGFFVGRHRGRNQHQH
jgi:hypothetical protein